MELLTNKLKILFSEQFYYAMCNCSNTTFHMVGAKIEPFDGSIPAPTNDTFSEIYQIHDELLFGKRILPEDVSFMIKNNQWTSGTKYPMYDDKDSTLQDTPPFVVSDQEDGSYAVFKCLYKNPITDPVSIYKPLANQTSPSDEVYITGDGYHWKYMFSIGATAYAKFATTNYAPVVLDQETISSALSGTIDAVLIEDIGADYSNYAYGKIKTANYGGNTLKFSITSDQVRTIKTYDITYNGNTAFTAGDVVTIQVPEEDPVEATVYKTEALSVSFEVTSNTQNITQSTVALSNTSITVSSNTASANVVSIQEENLPNLSDDNNFYKNAAFYIRGGAGAGQIKTISSYEVIGNDRVVTLDSAFSETVNLTSSFSILPKIEITGDGQGAIALAEIDPSANSISDIRVINRGSGYSFASATISGNSGIIDANGSPIFSSEASLRPIIAPPNGHGSDPVEELYGSNIGVSIKFTESEVLDDVSFSKFAMVRNLLADNVTLTLDSISEGDYAEDETVTQATAKFTRGKIKQVNTSNNTIVLTDVFGNFEVSSNTLLIGESSNSEIIAVSRSTDVFDNDLELTLSPIVSTFSVGEVVKQNNSNAYGIVIRSTPTVINIVEVFGTFTTNINDVLVGQTNGAQALVTQVGERKLVDNSGDVVYIENSSQIDRSPTTSEQIKLIIKF